MGRKSKKEIESADDSQMLVRARPIKKDDKKIELIDFARALYLYKKSNADRAVIMTDKEAIKVWVQKKCPSLRASKKDWNILLGKF